MPDAVWGQNYNPNVPNGYRECFTCGAHVPTSNRVQHENFHKTFSNIREQDMSQVAWCDYGDHAFKRGSEGSASFQGTEFDGNGVAINTTMDACGKHNPLNVSREAAKYSITSEEYRNVSE